MHDSENKSALDRVTAEEVLGEALDAELFKGCRTLGEMSQQWLDAVRRAVAKKEQQP